VPWKTRGNGSLVIRVGRGAGSSWTCGTLDGKALRAHERISEQPDRDELLERCVRVLEKRSSPDSEPGLLISERQPSSSLYWKGVRELVTREEVEEEIASIGAISHTLRGGRGIIGACCGMAWQPQDRSWEILAYRYEKRWGSPREFDLDSVRRMDAALPSTFNNWDEKSKKASVLPSTPCPVLYGVRGGSPDDLLLVPEMLKTEPWERWAIFLSNQGSDDHIIHRPCSLEPFRSYSISGRVAETSGRIEGGHSFLLLETRLGPICCALYEPSKEFRAIFDLLIPGDRIRVLGEMRDEPRTLNVEKLEVQDLAELWVRDGNPVCPDCGRRMHSIGRNQGYRCRPCGQREAEPPLRLEKRRLLPGWYEPPVAARRHLSKPLSRMGIEQPLYFV